MSRLKTIGTGKSPDHLQQYSLTIGSYRILKKRQEDSGNQNVDMSDVLDGFAQKARDHARVPVQVTTPLLTA